MSLQTDRSKKILKARVSAAQTLLKRFGADALVVSDLKNICYLTGFTGSNALCVITKGRPYFLTDSRYASQVKTEVFGFNVRIVNNSLEGLLEIAGREKIKSLVFEDSMSYAQFKRLGSRLKGVNLTGTSEGVSMLRRVKDALELSLMKEAAGLLDDGFKLAEELIRPGAIESKLAWQIESFFRESGGEGLSFETIIASGFRGAMPHGKASDKKIRRSELVVVDMGVVLNGYNSDETRTYSVGPATKYQKKIYDIVRVAQEKALGMVRHGVRAAAVDLAARRHIKKAGFDKYFGHGTGHGVGLDIHEGPSISPVSKDVLTSGMIVTVEPGIYLPGRFGVRIEDSVVVVNGGFEYLTKTGKELQSL